jgi:hypothetical protein
MAKTQSQTQTQSMVRKGNAYGQVGDHDGP